MHELVVVEAVKDVAVGKCVRSAQLDESSAVDRFEIIQSLSSSVHVTVEPFVSEVILVARVVVNSDFLRRSYHNSNGTRRSGRSGGQYE